jgi:hypothetical protein
MKILRQQPRIRRSVLRSLLKARLRFLETFDNVNGFPAAVGKQMYDDIGFPAAVGKQMYDDIESPAAVGKEMYNDICFPAAVGKQMYNDIESPAAVGKQMYDPRWYGLQIRVSEVLYEFFLPQGTQRFRNGHKAFVSIVKPLCPLW